MHSQVVDCQKSNTDLHQKICSRCYYAQTYILHIVIACCIFVSVFLKPLLRSSGQLAQLVRVLP